MHAIYHITHLRNLESIIRAGGLCCDTRTVAQSLNHVGIAHSHIKERRARHRVPITPQGTLADYVPFYFAPRSPMLYTIARNQVVGYTEGQQPIVHLVSSVEHVAQQKLAFVFTDGHADVAFSRFFGDLQSLDQVDWQIMKANFWNDTAVDGDRKRRRQAEFLVHDFLPWTLINQVGVMTDQIVQEVERILQTNAHRPRVTVCRHWYY